MILSRRRFLGLAAAAAFSGPVLAAPDSEGRGRVSAKALQAGQWAMVIDSRRFSQAALREAVIAACHSFHNVPQLPAPRRLDWLEQHSFAETFPGLAPDFLPDGLRERIFLTLCNHCRNPPCVRVCPTGASFCRGDGIVGVDVHRCIGCRYCMAACPFGARGFNFEDHRLAGANPAYPQRTRGVVEKCTFCAERLAEGRRPLCVEASDGAIAFGDLADPASSVRVLLAENFTLRRKPWLGTEPGVYYIL
ncbi:MAG: 4Fe-4S dicluster domain-containing protein [Deltaproteobacteria bacterium]|jgi:molybdopterin-containing oxidoreductase family iron-sulfur binding subunit|nr:4Fe-4S dicluster domain-containing protein [Deltaproteobacteria bacterium]